MPKDGEKQLQTTLIEILAPQSNSAPRTRRLLSAGALMCVSPGPLGDK